MSVFAFLLLFASCRCGLFVVCRMLLARGCCLEIVVCYVLCVVARCWLLLVVSCCAVFVGPRCLLFVILSWFVGCCFVC